VVGDEAGEPTVRVPTALEAVEREHVGSGELVRHILNAAAAPPNERCDGSAPARAMAGKREVVADERSRAEKTCLRSRLLR
jgi:hypothetical protein